MSDIALFFFGCIVACLSLVVVFGCKPEDGEKKDCDLEDDEDDN